MCVYIYTLHSFNVYTSSSLDTCILMLWLFVWPRQNFGLLFGQGSSGSSFGKKPSAWTIWIQVVWRDTLNMIFCMYVYMYIYVYIYIYVSRLLKLTGLRVYEEHFLKRNAYITHIIYIYFYYIYRHTCIT